MKLGLETETVLQRRALERWHDVDPGFVSSTHRRERLSSTQEPRSGRHAQACVNELFLRVHRQIVGRAELAKVAQQDDFMKRARDNGRAAGLCGRRHLGPWSLRVHGRAAAEDRQI